MRLYLDTCCLNRPLDDLSQTRIQMEAEAVLAILREIEARGWILVAGAVLFVEVARTPDARRRSRMQQFLMSVRERIAVGPVQIRRAAHLQNIAGFKEIDALHLACAESLGAEVFLTTDDRLLRGARQWAAAELPFPVLNPLDWLTTLLAEE